MDLISTTSETYEKYNYELADPRTNNFILMSSPFKLLSILGLYLWFCLKAGPRFMDRRNPFKLRNILIIYNLFQVVMSAYFAIVSMQLWLFKYSYKCEPVDYSYSPEALFVAKVVHIYFLSKIVELLDTVFFVLRKKYGQVSVLHLYHHTSMILCTWLGAKYYPGGQTTFIGLINSFVHTAMYFYYFLTCLGPKYQEYLTWKKYITKIQLVQFIILLLHSLQALPRKCDYPKSLVWLSLFQAVTFLYMFSTFYIQSYFREKKTKDVDDNRKLNENEKDVKNY